MLTSEDLLFLIRVKLEAVAGDKYPSQKMARQAAKDVLKNLRELEAKLEVLR